MVQYWGNVASGLGSLGPNQPSPDPLWDEGLCMLALVLTVEQGSFIYPARPCQYEKGLDFALSEELFVHQDKEPYITIYVSLLLPS